MGWIIAIIIFFIIFIVWLARKSKPKRTSSFSTTITQALPKTASRPKKTKEMLNLDIETKTACTIKMKQGIPHLEPAIKVRDVDIYTLGRVFRCFFAITECTKKFKISRVLSAQLCIKDTESTRLYSEWLRD